jgi:hypothetical protein
MCKSTKTNYNYSTANVCIPDHATKKVKICASTQCINGSRSIKLKFRDYEPTSSLSSSRHSLFFSSATNASNLGAAPAPEILLRAATARSVLR